MKYIVTVERLRDGVLLQRLMEARDAWEAGLKTCALIGGPGTTLYRVVECVAA